MNKFILSIFLFSSLAHSATQINIVSNKKSNITKHSSFYTDTTNKMGPQEVDNLINDKLINSDNINRKHSFHRHWFKIILNNNQKSSVTKYLSMQGTFPGNYIFYEKINGSWVKSGVFGSSLKFNDKKIHSTRATKELKFSAGEVKNILLLRQSQHMLSIKIKLESIVDFYQYETKKTSQFLFFLGLVIVIFTFNILLFLYRKNGTALAFIFFMLSLTFFLSVLNGSIDLINWGISPSFKHHAPLICAITLFFGTIFLYIFLDLKSKKSFIYKLSYISPALTIVYCISYITNLDRLFSIPTGLVIDYIITMAIIIYAIILIKSIKDKLPGAMFFSLSIFAFIIPIIYWLIVELYSPGVSHDSEPALLIGSFLCFTIFNLHSYLQFRQSYSNNQRSYGDVQLSEKYQTIVRMLTHDLATPLMTIKESTKKMKKLVNSESSENILKRISGRESILLELITQMRQKEKESSDLALICNIEKKYAYQLILSSLKNLSFDTKEFNIELKQSGNFSIVVDKDLFYKKVFYPITSFLFPLMSKSDKVIISCEKENSYTYIIFKCFTQNEIANMLPHYKDEIAENFNLDLIDSLEDIKQILISHKYLNAMGSTIKIKRLHKK